MKRLKEIWSSLGKPLQRWLIVLLIISYSYYLLDITEVLYTAGIVNLYYLLFYTKNILGAILGFILAYRLLKNVK